MFKTRVILAMLITFGMLSFSTASALPAASAAAQNGPHPAFMAGEMTMPGQPGGVKTETFVCTPAHFNKGEKLPMRVNSQEGWSVRKQSIKVGQEQMGYPVIGMIRHDGGNFAVLIAATVTFKKPVPAGEAYRSGGWSIIVSHAVRAGKVVPVVMIDQKVILSVQSMPRMEHGRKESVPWLRIMKTELAPRERTAAESEWHEMRRVAGLGNE